MKSNVQKHPVKSDLENTILISHKLKNGNFVMIDENYINERLMSIQRKEKYWKKKLKHLKNGTNGVGELNN